MARRLRIQYSDAIYHVMARGNGRQDIVQDDADRGRLVACLERTVRRSGWSLYAFVFLTNHLHLVLQTPRPNLAKGMQLFLSSYANGWARRHRHCKERFSVSEHLFAWRTTTTARLTDDAEAMGNDLDPVLRTVGPATAHRRPHAIQLLGRLFPTDLPSPAGPTFRLSATELLPFRERVQDGIGMPGAMAAVARPGILARIGHHRGPHRVGLDVPQYDEQVVAVLDDRGSEAALPDVAAGSLSAVVPPGVSDRQGLEDAADRLPGGRLEKQMKMVGHQAVAEERERIPCLGAGEIAKEHIPFAVGAEDIGSVVPAVDRVVNQVIACRSWKSSHESNLPT